MRILLTAFALTLASQVASAGEVRNIELQTNLAPVTITLDESSISHKDDNSGREMDAICRVTVKISGLANKALLAATAAHNEATLSAGRWCLTTPLESLVAAFRDAGGSLSAEAVLKLTESRYEVEAGHGEPDNIGKCNRTIIESVDIPLPLGRKLGSFQEKRLQTTTMQECFK